MSPSHPTGAPPGNCDTVIISGTTTENCCHDTARDGLFLAQSRYFARRAVHQGNHVCDWRVHVEQPHIAAITAMHMGCVDNSDAGISAHLGGFNQLRDHSPCGRRFHRSANRDEVILHVNDNHRGRGWIDRINAHHSRYFPQGYQLAELPVH